MNGPRKKKAIKIYQDFAAKSLTHNEIMAKLKSDLDNNYSKAEIEEIEATIVDAGLKVPSAASTETVKPANNHAKALPLTGGNRHYQEWLCDVKWPRDDENKVVKGSSPTVEKMKMLRGRVIITKETADSLNHGHIAPSCNRPILYLLPDTSLPEGY